MSVDHLTPEQLDAGLDQVRSVPSDVGTVELIVRRPAVEAREQLDECELDTRVGLVGDTWSQRPGSSREPASGPHPEAQLTLMNVRVAELIAQEPSRRALAGDQLYVDFDISVDNLPAGTRLQVGSAVVEITAKPHLGCAKFTKRFGLAAMRWVNSDIGKALRLRGVNAKVVEGGTVRVGDKITKL
jgi:hypothetical protein